MNKKKSQNEESSFSLNKFGRTVDIPPMSNNKN